MTPLRHAGGWQREVAVVILLGALVLGAGLASGALLLFVLPAVLGYLAWHLVQLARFLHGLRSDTLSRKGPPGAWGDAWTIAHDLQAARLKARRKLQRFDTRFRDAAASFPDALIALSRSRNVRWCNQIALDLFFDDGLEHITGRRLHELVVSEPLQSYLETGDFDRPLIIAAPQDRSRVLSVRVLPFGRKKHQLMLIGSDITRMYHLDEARRDFVANVSHELRTPLTVIAGYLEPLADHLRGEREWSHSLVLMQQQAARMNRMIDDLTLLSRLESEEKPRHDETIEIGSLIDDVLVESKALAIAATHEVTIAAQRDTALRGDRIEIRSVVSNLLVNALRHTPAGTHVEITWRRTGDGAALEVRDDGPGIDPAHLPRLTERFFRVDPGRSRRSGGTGLGLAIVKHVLSRHDAQLSIQSEPGRGSTFRCEFPFSRLLRLPAAAAPDRA